MRLEVLLVNTGVSLRGSAHQELSLEHPEGGALLLALRHLVFWELRRQLHRGLDRVRRRTPSVCLQLFLVAIAVLLGAI